MSLRASSKEEWRLAVSALPGGDGPPQAEWGRLAQRVRGLEAYRAAKRIFVGPSPVLSQIRMNVLSDGKELLMPAPGLKEGFYLCKPYEISFPELCYATTYRGLPKFGRLLAEKALAGTEVGLLVTDAVAIDRQGTRLGDGQGYFDLACAILAELGGLERQHATVVAVAADGQVVAERLPADPWDVELNEVITPSGGMVFADVGTAQPEIHWQQIVPERIRRLDPLWKLSSGQRRG